MLQKHQINDVEISARIEGAGIPVIFLHGFPFDRTVWDHVLDSLAKKSDLLSRFMFVAPDLRGFGESGINSKNTSMEDMADDVNALLDIVTENKDAKAILCGLSMGGYVLMQFVRKYSDRLDGAIFCNTKTEADTPEAARGRRAMADSLTTEGLADLADSMIPKLFCPESLETKRDVIIALRSRILAQKPEGVSAAARGMADREDTGALLATIKVPTLLVSGQYDQLSPPESMQTMARSVERSEFAVVPNSAHLPMLENPDAFTCVITGFLRGL